MAVLPKYELPRFKHKLYTIKKPIEFRTYTAGEQKQLLLVKEGTSQEKADAIKTVVKACTFEKIDVDELAYFDVEDLFLQIRSRSVSNECTVQFKVKDTDETVKVTVDLNDVKVKTTEDHDNNVRLTDSIGVVFKYPTLDMIVESEQKDLTVLCVDYIYDRETIITKADISEQELIDWFNSLDYDAMKKIAHFFDTMPKLSHEVEVKYKKDGEQKSTTIVLEGINDFLG
jgi:hypothetical protein